MEFSRPAGTGSLFSPYPRLKPRAIFAGSSGTNGRQNASAFALRLETRAADAFVVEATVYEICFNRRYATGTFYGHLPVG